VGIVTDRDIALKLGLGEAEPTSPAKRIMTSNVTTIWDDQGVFNATQYLMGHKVRRLPIVDREDNLVGMVTLDDVLRAVSPGTQELEPRDWTSVSREGKRIGVSA
jgi:CBS domain-containing protein